MKRSHEQVIWDFVQSWLRKADGDLRAMDYLLVMEQEDYFTVGFHAQQAAEKYLKAFLVRYQIPFPKTHEIQQLLELTSQSDSSLKIDLSSTVMLTPFGVLFRYPGEEVIDRETARQAAQEARKVQTIVLERLKDYLDQGRPQREDKEGSKRVGE